MRPCATRRSSRLVRWSRKRSTCATIAARAWAGKTRSSNDAVWAKFSSQLARIAEECPYSSTPSPVAAVAWNRASCRPIRRTRRTSTAPLSSRFGSMPSPGNRRIWTTGSTQRPGPSTKRSPLRLVSQATPNPQVDIRAEPTVQAHLVDTGPPAPLHRREVKEVEFDRLLGLVGVRAGKDHPGDVRLMKTQIVGRVWVGL
jgi:hypothetical protein